MPNDPPTRWHRDEWRGVEAEAWAAAERLARAGRRNTAEDNEDMRTLLRRAVAHGVRVSAEQSALGLPPGRGRAASALAIVADAIERGEIET